MRVVKKGGDPRGLHVSGGAHVVGEVAGVSARAGETGGVPGVLVPGVTLRVEHSIGQVEGDINTISRGTGHRACLWVLPLWLVQRSHFKMIQYLLWYVCRLLYGFYLHSWRLNNVPMIGGVTLPLMPFRQLRLSLISIRSLILLWSEQTM